MEVGWRTRTLPGCGTNKRGGRCLRRQHGGVAGLGHRNLPSFRALWRVGALEHAFFAFVRMFFALARTSCAFPRTLAASLLLCGRRHVRPEGALGAAAR